MTNANDKIGTRENKITMFSCILSCKIRPREFMDRNIFYAGYEKSEIREENTKRLIKDYKITELLRTLSLVDRCV